MDDEDDSEFQFGARPAPELEDSDEKTMYGSASASKFSTMRANVPSLRRRTGGEDVESPAPMPGRFAGIEDSKAQNDARNRKLLRELKRGDRVNVKIQPLCLFLFRDGTVISIHKGKSCNCTRSAWSLI